MTQPQGGVEERRSWVFWPLAVAGWLIMAYAVRGIFMHEGETRPVELFKLLIGLDLVHDFILAPVVACAGYLLTRLVPPWGRPPVIGALFVSATVMLFAYPLVRGYGRFAEYNASRLPNNYAHGLLIVLAAIWAVTALFVIIRFRRHR